MGGVQFTVFGNDTYVLMVNTNGYNVVIRTQEQGLQLVSVSKWWHKKYYYVLKDETGNTFATLEDRKLELCLEDGTIYTLVKRKTRHQDNPKNLYQYDVMRGEEFICTIASTRKSPWIYSPLRIEDQGYIHCYANVTLLEVGAFLRLLYMELIEAAKD